MRLVYTTCSTKLAESILNNSFRTVGSIETYSSIDTAVKMACPGDEWLVVLGISTKFSFPVADFIANLHCPEGIPDGFLQGLIKLSNASEVLGGLGSREV